MKTSLPKLSELHSENDVVIVEKNVMSQNVNDIAIIGMDFNFAEAQNADEFWEIIADGIDCIGDIPENRRKDIDQYFYQVFSKESMKYKQLAYLRQIDKFDYRFFKLSKKEADLMDPNQRLFLQCAYHAIEDAGYLNQIEGSNTGVYVGFKSSLANTYYNMVRDVEPNNVDMASVGNKVPVIASRISYLLDLHGPNMVLDTACSSSLVALHLACQALKNEECDTAIVGSVRLELLPLMSEFNIGIESSDGKTKTFDNRSDGTGGGEGVAAIFLKPLDKARQDKDHIYAVIKGSAVNQDGKSIGLTAPNATAQERVILKAWERAGINLSAAGYLEAHGTGTKLGDPIEIEGLTKAFSQYTSKKQFCSIGSIKANLGHLDNCAGMAGIIKVILMMQHKKLPPLVHFQIPNMEIDFWNSPFYINKKMENWISDTSRYCGISSFGLSGTNAHIVLEEYSDDANLVTFTGKIPFVITAKTEEALKEQVVNFTKYLQHKTMDLYSLCYTMAFRRKHYSKRLAFLVSSQDELLDLLEQWMLHKEKSEEDEYLKCFEAGESIDFSMYFPTKAMVVNAPLYPFEKHRCWLDYRERNLEKKTTSAEVDFKTAIVNVYEEVLGVHPIEPELGFYELGGDSLIALKIVNVLADKYKIKLEISDVLVNGSISAILKCYEENYLNSDKTDLFSHLKKADERKEYPLSSPQKRMFVMDWYKNIGSVYNMNRAFIVSGYLDIEKTKEVFKKIVYRHESLRTSFDFKNEEPVQIIHEEVDFEVEVSDVIEAQIEEKVMKFFRKFDLKEAPLFRVGILKINPIRNVLILDMHHIISDGTSTGVIMKEFVELYEGGVLPELEYHYRDYTMWQIECSKYSEMDKQRKHWHNVFSDNIPILQLPYDYDRPKERDFRGKRVSGEIDEDLTFKLRQVANNKNTSLHILLLCAYYILLAKYSNQEDIVVGVATSGRNSTMIENNVGMFVNTLPIRAYPEGGKSLGEFLDELKDISYEAYRNQDYQLDDLIENLNISRDNSRNPLFDAVFTITKFEKIHMKELDFDVLNYEMIKARFDLIMTMCDYGEIIDYGITYAAALFEEGTIKKMLNDYHEILEQLCESMEVEIDDVLVIDKSFSQVEMDMISFDFIL